jgi:hypothetical protein
MEEAIKDEVKAFTLPKKKILVVPIKRKGKWLPPGHEAEFLFKHSTLDLPLPKVGGVYRECLTKEEKEFFESSEAGLALGKDDLNIHNKADNYWDTFHVKLDKNIKVLDLSNPLDYLSYKVLLQNTYYIAPSAAEQKAKGTYKFCLTEEGYENEEKVKAASSKKEAYKFMGKIDHSVGKMKDFLNVYYTIKPGGKQIPPNASQDFCIAELEKLVESDLSAFLDIVRDANYDDKVLVHNALTAKALLRDGLTFKTPEGTIIGENMDSVISFLNNDKNSEEVIKIKGRIDNAK